MVVLFKDCGDDGGEFRTPARQWNGIHDILDQSEQFKLIEMLFALEGVVSVGFEGDTISVGKLDVTWNDLSPMIEATIECCIAA